MTSLEYYLQDGANWQAKAILAILQMRQNEVLDIVWNKETHRNEGDISANGRTTCIGLPNAPHESSYQY